MNIRRDPLDFEALKKGDRILVDEMEVITGHKRDSLKFARDVQSLCAKVERELARRGYPVTCRMLDLGLAVLTDKEASEYNDHRFRDGLGLAVKSHGKANAVDQRNLDDGDKKRHDRRLEIQGRYMQAVVKTSQAIRVEGVKRSTPGLIKPDDPDKKVS
jgi:hypothetical protein